MLALVTLVFIIILVVGHELGHFLAAKLLGIRVDEFGIGFPPKLWSKKVGETEYSFNLLPFGGFVKIHGDDSTNAVDQEPERSFPRQPYWKKFLVIISGVLINFLIAWIAFSIVFASGTPKGILIESVAPGSPAAEAQIEAGVLIDGFDDVDNFIAYIDENRGQEIVINGTAVTPRVNPPEGEGALGIVLLETGSEGSGILESIGLGLKASWQALGAIFVALGTFLWGVVTGNFEVLGNVSGPVGVFEVVQQATNLGLIYLTQLLGLISLNLAALNIIPFPALDGGRLFFTSLQSLFGEKLFSRKLEFIVNIAGFIFLLGLMIVVTIKDIITL